MHILPCVVIFDDGLISLPSDILWEKSAIAEITEGDYAVVSKGGDLSMVTLTPEDISALRREEQQLPSDFPRLRDLIHTLGTLSASGEPVGITIAEPDVPRWLTTRDVADMFRISERAVRHWCEQGHVVAMRTPGPRGVWRIRADQFAASSDAVTTLLDTVVRLNGRFDAEPPDEYER